MAEVAATVPLGPVRHAGDMADLCLFLSSPLPPTCPEPTGGPRRWPSAPAFLTAVERATGHGRLNPSTNRGWGCAVARNYTMDAS